MRRLGPITEPEEEVGLQGASKANGPRLVWFCVCVAEEFAYPVLLFQMS